MEEMATSDCLFAVVVTIGSLLRNVRFREGLIETETVVMRSVTGTVRWIGRSTGNWTSFIWGRDNRL